jgi:MYXO-CTERM domain-containing protein
VGVESHSGVPDRDRIDLLSVLLHEVGHVLGYEHTSGGLMAGEIEPGTQLSVAIPAALDARPAAVGTRPTATRLAPAERVTGIVESANGAVDRVGRVVEPVGDAVARSVLAVDVVADVVARGIVSAADPAVRTGGPVVDLRSLSASSATATPWNQSLMPAMVVALGLLVLLRRRRVV